MPATTLRKTLRQLIATAIRSPNQFVPRPTAGLMLDWQMSAVEQVLLAHGPADLDLDAEFSFGGRGSGKTHRLLEATPDGGIFIVKHAGMIGHCRSMLARMGRARRAVRFMAADGELGTRLAGMTAHIVVDHDAEPDRRALDMIEIVNIRAQRLAAERDIEDDGFVTVHQSRPLSSCICGVLAVPGCPVHYPHVEPVPVLMIWGRPTDRGRLDPLRWCEACNVPRGVGVCQQCRPDNYPPAAGVTIGGGE